MSLLTYRGIVRDGKVEPTSAITAQVAKRKANSWLVGYVGNLLMADDGILVQSGSTESPEWVWRFQVFVTSPSQAPSGPISTVDVDAVTGAILSGEQTKAMLYERGRAPQHPL